MISKRPICFKHFPSNNWNYVTQLFYDTGNTKEWVKLKHEFNLNNNPSFNWMQLIHQPHKFTFKNILMNAYLIGSVFTFFHAL